MLAEIISELNNAEDNANVTSEQMLARTKRVEAQRAKFAVINNLSEMKESDKIQTVRDEQRQNGRNPHSLVKMAMKQNCKCCESSCWHTSKRFAGVQ